MFRWRTLLLALALVLSLPLRLAGVAPAPCHVTPAELTTAVSTHAPQTFISHAKTADPPAVVAANGHCSHAYGTSTNDPHPSGPCGMNAPCCIGALPTSAPRVSAPALSMLLVMHLVSDPASPFLTEGVDRPPREFLV